MSDKTHRPQSTESTTVNTPASLQETGQEQPSNSEQNAQLEESQQQLTPAQKAQALVARLGTNIGKNPLRQEYMETVAAMSSQVAPMRAEGKTDEEIARALHQRRIDIGKQYKELTPQPLREFIFEINMGRYGNEYGPPVDYLLKKYNGDWTKIIESSCRPNGSVDTLLQSFGSWLLTIDGARLDRWHAEWCA